MDNADSLDTIEPNDIIEVSQHTEQPNRIRVVASYTTLPSRYDVLRSSMNTLLAQTYKLDAIYLALPAKAARLNKEYPPLPDDIAAMCTVVRIDTDYGPGTKIYGALVSETDPNTVIISCDDDVFFEPNFVEVLLSHHKTHPQSCICGTGALIGRGLWFISIVSSVSPFHKWKGFTGFTIGKDGRKVDLIFGVAGVLYTRGMFPTNEDLYNELFRHCLEDNTIFYNDDVLISGYLSKQGIERRTFYDIPPITHANGEDALSSDFFRMITRMNTAIQRVKQLGFYTTMEESSVDETPAWRVIVIIIIAIIILVLCWSLYRVV